MSADENALREKLATCTRILAMQGLVGVFGHVSVYQPGQGRMLICPGSGSDKANTSASEIFVLDLEGQVLEGEGHVAIEWPIHAALHRARADALAVAHLHAPFTTLFAIAEREFRPVTLHGALFGDGLPLYDEARLIVTLEQGRNLVNVMGDKRAALLRGHGAVVVARDIEEMFYASLILEDNARKAMQAVQLGQLRYLNSTECAAFESATERSLRASRVWTYFAGLESRWDRQPASGAMPLA